MILCEGTGTSTVLVRWCTTSLQCAGLERALPILYWKVRLRTSAWSKVYVEATIRNGGILYNALVCPNITIMPYFAQSCPAALYKRMRTRTDDGAIAKI